MRKGSRKISVCLVSQHPLFLTEFAGKLTTAFTSKQFRIEKGAAGVEQLARLPRSEVYAVDASGPLHATQRLIAAILDHFPRGRIIAAADEFTEDEAFQLLELGVKGLSRYADANSQFSRASDSVARGGYWVPRMMLSRFVEQMLTHRRRRRMLQGTSKISRREKEILACLLENRSNKEIAAALNISERTVKFHVSNLLAKYRVQRRADLILLSLTYAA